MGQIDKYFTWSRNEMVSLLPDNYLTVIEIGSGTGTFRQNLKHDCEYWAIEPDSNAARECNENTNIKHVYNATYKQIVNELPENYFDLVICNDVIEHMDDHDWFLDSIKDKMKRGSCLVGSVPNAMYLKNFINFIFMKDWRYAESGVMDRTHLRFFTKKSLKRTLFDHGYKIDVFSGIKCLIRCPGSTRDYLIGAVGILVLILSAGYYRDCLCLQYAFRVSVDK